MLAASRGASCGSRSSSGLSGQGKIKHSGCRSWSARAAARAASDSSHEPPHRSRVRRASAIRLCTGPSDNVTRKRGINVLLVRGRRARGVRGRGA